MRGLLLKTSTSLCHLIESQYDYISLYRCNGPITFFHAYSQLDGGYGVNIYSGISLSQRK